MKIFISCSGQKSQAIASELKVWLQSIIQQTNPWIAAEMKPGMTWVKELSEQLSDSRHAIICLTRDNIISPWIHFEVGAISNSKDSNIYTILFNVNYSDVKPPLSFFQHTDFTHDSLFTLFLAIRDNLEYNGVNPIGIEGLKSLFDSTWPKFKSKVDNILSENNPHESSYPKRSELDKIEELVAMIRKNNDLMDNLNQILRSKFVINKSEIQKHKIDLESTEAIDVWEFLEMMKVEGTPKNRDLGNIKGLSRSDSQ